MFEEKRKRKWKGIFLAAAIGVVLLTASAAILNSGYVTQNEPPQQQVQPPGMEQPRPQQLGAEAASSPTPTPMPTPTLTPMPMADVSTVVTSVAKSALPGVVGISVLKADSDALFDRNAGEKWGVGSGVVVSTDGYIVTNHHVAGGKSKRIIVSFSDGRNLEGVTKWSDPVLDLAVVKVNASNLTTIPLGDATKLQVGESAIAIGNPLGLQFQRTVTYGIISALNRTIEVETEQGTNYMEDLIQTDASINPGNSGGPLLNARGEVIGINTIKVSGAEAMGFAIPINIVAPIVKQMTDTGDFKEPYLGIFAYDKEVIPYVDSNIKVDKGIYVSYVDEEAPAYKAGIRLSCIIKQVDGIDMNTMLQLRTYLYSKKPGDTIQITHIMHETGETVTVPVCLCSKDKDGLITR